MRLKVPDEIVRRFKCFKKKDFELFCLAGVISGAFDEDDVKVLEAIKKIWRKPVFLKRQLAYYTRKERFKFLETCCFNKIDAYIFSSIRKKWEKGERVNFDELTFRVMRAFNIKPTELAEKMIKRKIKNVRKYVAVLSKLNKDFQEQAYSKKGKISFKEKLEQLIQLSKSEETSEKN